MKKIIILAILLLMAPLYSQFNPLEYAWDSREEDIVKSNWSKTVYSAKISSYVENTYIKGGYIQRQFIFYDGKLASLIALIFSNELSYDIQSNIIWGIPYRILGEPAVKDERYSWLRHDLKTFAFGGVNERDELWFSAFSNTEASINLLKQETVCGVELIHR